MSEAANRRLPVVFITDDSRSDDWYRREHGLTLGARYELRAEMTHEAGVPLLMMTTETFLRHAKTYLDATVSDETVDQAKELPYLWIEVKGPPAKPVYAGAERFRKDPLGAYAELAQPAVTNIGAIAQVVIAAILIAEGLSKLRRDCRTRTRVRGRAFATPRLMPSSAAPRARRSSRHPGNSKSRTTSRPRKTSDLGPAPIVQHVREGRTCPLVRSR
jgi:hypothetical protein